MIVGFPFAFGGNVSKEQQELAELFVKMMRRFQPDATLVQMTDITTMAIKGIDECFRTKSDRLGPWYFNAMSNFPAEQFLRLDYDTVVRGDVSDVFNAPFDIAISKERNGLMNNGVVFVKDRGIFEDALDFYENETLKDDWYDIQASMQMAIDDGQYRVKKLDQGIYNYFYEAKSIPQEAKIVHFKGFQKKHMRSEFPA